MAKATKPAVKKNTKPAAPAPKADEPVAASRDKKSVFVKLTATELYDRIGGEVKVGVSRRDLTALLLKEKKKELLKSVGLD